MRVNVCRDGDIEEANGELFIKVPDSSIRGGGMCWLPPKAGDLVKETRMQENGRVPRGTVFVIVKLAHQDAVYPCRDFITFPGGDVAALLGVPLVGKPPVASKTRIWADER